MASKQILFFEKSVCDQSRSGIIATASQGNDYTSFVFNRSNLSGWVTSGSVDADNTTFEVNFGTTQQITDIILLLHNFKSYTIQYWNDSAWTDFSTAIAETTNTSENTHHNFTAVTTQKVKLTITGTIVSNSDKILRQFIVTNRIGQLACWPIINNPTISRNRQRSQMLSGKQSIRENIGSFSCKLKVDYLKSDADLTIIENIYDSNEGFLVWLCGGDETQFSTVRKGYRLEDIYLMKCSDEWQPKWYQGLYKTGLQVDIDLVEVVD